MQFVFAESIIISPLPSPTDPLPSPIPPQPPEAEEDDEAEEVGVEEVYCLCREPERGRLLGCDGCDEWFHIKCVGLSAEGPRPSSSQPRIFLS